MPKASAKSLLGLSPEVTPGVAKTPTIYIPVHTITPKDTVTQLTDKGWRGAMVDEYDVQAGMIVGSVDFDGDVYLDSIGYLLAGMMGDVVETGSSAPYTHTFAVLNSGQGQPVSQTITDDYSAGIRAYAYAMYNELDFKLSPDALLTYSAKTTSFGSATGTVPSPAFSGLEPLVGWSAVAQIGGTVTSLMTDFEINIKRTATAVKPINNSQVPSSIFVGPLAVEGKATMLMEDDTFLTDYLNGTKTSLDVKVTQGTGSIEFHMSKVNISAADIQRGKDMVEIPISFKAFGNSTDIGASGGYGQLVVTLINAVASGLY
jgi:hypothetical protein